MPEADQFYCAHPVESIGGEITVPGDKSISHRALLLGAVAEGDTHIKGFLQSGDCLATRAALENLGVTMENEPDGTLTVHGVGPQGLTAPDRVLDLGNSGTALRLLAGLLAAQPFDSRLTGDDSLRQRPMERVVKPLRVMGADIETEGEEGHPPLTIKGGQKLRGAEHTLQVASAQVKSALLLAGLWAHGRTTVHSPATTRDHTERMLQTMGVETSFGPGERVSLEGPATLKGTTIAVPGDFSSAAFFLVAGCLAAPTGLVVKNVGVNPSRTGLLSVLHAMGAQIELRNTRMNGTEPVADIEVRKSPLHGIDVPPELVSLAIDEFPILFLAAACAEGQTVVGGADELRHKESDRLTVMAKGLTSLGATVVEKPDGLSIQGGTLVGGRVDSHGDHRVAMAFTMASLLTGESIEILNTAQVATSFPDFLETAVHAGLKVETGRHG